MGVHSSSGTPGTMHAAFPARPGGPEVIKFAERPTPRPENSEVLIRVAYAGVNRHDCNQRRRGAPPPNATDILGLEASGQIVEVGGGVTQHRVGDSVCALVNGGAYAEYVVASEDVTFRLPVGIDKREAAALPEGLFTAWLNLVDLCNLEAGETLLVHGGASGVGVIAIQLGRILGANVLATAGTNERCAFALSIGASSCFNYSESDFVQGVMSVTGGRGADVILDMAGGLYAERNLQALAHRGRITHLSSGGTPVYSATLALLMQKQARVTGSLLRSLEPDRKRQIALRLHETVWPLLGTKMVPAVEMVMPLRDAARAHERMEAGLNKGKILLQP